MAGNNELEAMQRRGAAERRSTMKPVMYRVYDGNAKMRGIHSAQQQISSRNHQWQPHHVVQIPTQGNRNISRRRSESDVNETARMVFPQQRQAPVQMSSRMQPALYRPSQIGKKGMSRNRRSNKMNIKTAPATLSTTRVPHTPRMPTPFISPQELRTGRTQDSTSYADGANEQPSSSPPSVMDRLKGWIKRQSPFRDERSIVDGKTGGTISNDKSIYSHYFDSELDKLTPVPPHKLATVDLRKQVLPKTHDFPLIDHTDEVSCEMPESKSQSRFKDHQRGRSSTKDFKSAVEDRRYLTNSDFRGGRYTELGRRKSSKRRHRRKQGSDLSGEESEFERNMAVTFLCLRLQSIKVDEERLKRLEHTMLSNGQPSVSAREAMDWLLSHSDRLQENAKKSSEKLRAVFADINIPVECAVKVLEIFVRNGALFRKKDTEIKCTEFFGFRKTVSMDDITDILYYLAREQMHREFRGENLIT